MVAEADLMTLLSGLEPELVGLSASPDSRRWRALRAARSLMAFEVEGETSSGLATPPLTPLPPLPPLPRSDTSPELPAETKMEVRVGLGDLA